MKKVIFFTFLISTLPSCWRAVDWAHSNFYQGTSLCYPISVNAYLKSVRVHELLSVRATFDALWLSDAVRTAYVDLYTMRHGINNHQRDTISHTQLADNQQNISFFVLSSYEVPLIGDQAEWGLFLKIDGNNYTPIIFKEVDLVPEYRAFFGKKFNQFKVAYLVQFAACDAEGRSVITSDVDHIALYFRSLNKEVRLIWELENI